MNKRLFISVCFSLKKIFFWKAAYDQKQVKLDEEEVGVKVFVEARMLIWGAAKGFRVVSFGC